MSKVKSLLQKYQAVFYGEAWYGHHISKRIELLTPEIVFQKPKENLKSIAEILWHMTAWRKYIIQKLEGNSDFRIEMNTSFDWPDALETSHPSWGKIVDDFYQTQTKLEQILAQKEDSLLTQAVPGAKQFDYEFILEGIIQHDIYHLGQIVLIQKLLS